VRKSAGVAALALASTGEAHSTLTKSTLGSAFEYASIYTSRTTDTRALSRLWEDPSIPTTRYQRRPHFRTLHLFRGLYIGFAVASQNSGRRGRRDAGTDASAGFLRGIATRLSFGRQCTSNCSLCPRRRLFSPISIEIVDSLQPCRCTMDLHRHSHCILQKREG
jgi:hypothetical protein